MSARTIKTLMRQIERKKAALAKLRDELRDLERDLSSLGDDVDEALSNLFDATDALSRIV